MTLPFHIVKSASGLAGAPRQLHTCFLLAVAISDWSTLPSISSSEALNYSSEFLDVQVEALESSSGSLARATTLRWRTAVTRQRLPWKCSKSAAFHARDSIPLDFEIGS